MHLALPPLSLDRCPSGADRLIAARLEGRCFLLPSRHLVYSANGRVPLVRGTEKVDF